MLATSYFREQKHYSFYDIYKKLSKSTVSSSTKSDDSHATAITEDECKKVLGVLKKYGVVKSVDSKKPEYEDLSDLDVVIADVGDDAQAAYKFCFVGVVIVENCVFCCYPKYIDSDDSYVPKKELKQILEVIRKYDSQEQSVNLYNGFGEDKIFDRLAISLFLLHDYYENGLYTNQHDIIETNGDGEILWDNTINETFAILKNNKPYYVELQTLNTVSNELDYFKLLHECVLTECSKMLSDAGVLELFDLMPVKLSSQSVSDFGDIDYIKYMLEKEIREQYVTKKQMLLKTLYAYISETKSYKTSDAFSFYGTNSFNLVWEKACSEIFDSIRDRTFDSLKRDKVIDDRRIRNPNYRIDFECSEPKYLDDGKYFRSLIEQITWTFNERAIKAADTLEPDILSIMGKSFFILDAKYYFIRIDTSGIHQQPGIQDIVKQFAYHRAFVDFIKDFNIENVSNAFLLPQKWTDTSNKDFNIIGKAEFKLMQFYKLELLSPIQIVELNPSFVYEHYLHGKKCTEKLHELIDVKKDKQEITFSSQAEQNLRVADAHRNVRYRTKD